MEPTDNVRRTARRRALQVLLGTAKGKAFVSMLALSAVAAVGMAVTQASYTDQVDMARVEVTGGTLDLQANNMETNAGWTGELSAAIVNSAPGDVYSSTVNVENNGSLPMNVTVSTDGEDADGCYKFSFLETDVIAGTGDGTPAAITGLGTTALEAGMVAVGTDVVASVLADVDADDEWDATGVDKDVKEYTLTVLHAPGCTDQGANATLDFTFDAAQV